MKRKQPKLTRKSAGNNDLYPPQADKISDQKIFSNEQDRFGKGGHDTVCSKVLVIHLRLHAVKGVST